MTANSDIEIVPYQKRYQPHFIALNKAWLEEYFYVEDHDMVILNSCEEHIIQKGGYIYFAIQNEEVVGCYALLRVSEKVFELGKMAVDKNFRGQHIGHLLMEHCMDLARSESWEKIILYSSVKLKNALHIYQKFGFREIPLEKDAPYQRSSIKMEKIISNIK
ncbi:GNAT family N-acetyltransferase [Robertkochia flava]|uniref:GNAT family N-acetyltransferase n=1 Tax=Robertkochia flava TaxID=3447986 RepID=UPI001CCA5CE0|nr:GNAT family N-acetyltransferase [Robertkochia marina]